MYRLTQSNTHFSTSNIGSLLAIALIACLSVSTAFGQETPPPPPVDPPALAPVDETDELAPVDETDELWGVLSLWFDVVDSVLDFTVGSSVD